MKTGACILCDGSAAAFDIGALVAGVKGDTARLYTVCSRCLRELGQAAIDEPVNRAAFRNLIAARRGGPRIDSIRVGGVELLFGFTNDDDTKENT